MANGLNKALLIGNLGDDPELRFTQNNRAVLKMRLATTESVPGGEGQERKELTFWHNVVIWGNRAEALSKLLSKGSRIYVEGRIEGRTYDDKDGVKRNITEISAFNIILLDGKRDNAGDAPRGNSQRSSGNANGGQRGQQRSQGSQNTQGRQQQRTQEPKFEDDFGGGDFGSSGDDDIPF